MMGPLMQTKPESIIFVSLGNLAPMLLDICELLWIFGILFLLLIREGEIRKFHQMQIIIPRGY